IHHNAPDWKSRASSIPPNRVKELSDALAKSHAGVPASVFAYFVNQFGGQRKKLNWCMLICKKPCRFGRGLAFPNNLGAKAEKLRTSDFRPFTLSVHAYRTAQQ